MRTFECFDEFNLVCFISGLFLNVYFKEEHEFPINQKSRNMKVKLQVYIYIYRYIYRNHLKFFRRAYKIMLFLR
jgi:hypothetical protein